MRDFLDREIKVGDFLALADGVSNISKQRLVMVYEISPKRIHILKHYYNNVTATYALKTNHMALLDKSRIPEPLKKEFIDYYREKYREGKFQWNESILGSYI